MASEVEALRAVLSEFEQDTRATVAVLMGVGGDIPETCAGALTGMLDYLSELKRWHGLSGGEK